MRVLMLPHLQAFRSEESGIKRVVEAYFQYLPQFGVDLVHEDDACDLVAVHAGQYQNCDVAHNHGLYWTADYPAVTWEWAVNAKVVQNLRMAKEITVPSEWVAETIRRDMRRRPHVIGHGIDWQLWQHDEPVGDYVLWNKNRQSDVCDPRPVTSLANTFKKQHFVTTFATKDKPNNVNDLGIIPHEAMKQLVQNAAVYLATVKETFGIGILEAMAAGVPVLGYGHGGILDLVEHGVSGYLATPGDLDDLADGLTYCLKHRRTLGANGRERAKAYTWERVVEQVAEVYRLAMVQPEPRVTVVIPSYNYAHKVGRAIESVLAQTFADFELFVVDDGSPDDGATERAVAQFEDARVRYIRQNNAGVAEARNRGIAEGTAPFICCLDADDAMAPRFLEACVDALVEDNGLGIAFTRLRYILPSGEEGLSPWPDGWDFDRQLKRQNQVPTCCVFRREMWEALGGYRSRYCPEGAGSEDAEFWTRCGAYGWRAEMVTEEPLFVYSWQSGRVSGSRDYSEVDWLAWHPWVEDGQHPFASYAKPKKFSHPVRAYDEPVVSVIIPVGPGHERDVDNALDSLDAQTYRRWEAILVDDTGGDGLDLTAFPHVHLVTTAGAQGAGFARNRGAEIARAPFLLFLDADDWLYPEAIEKMLREWEETEAIIYSDYVGKAFVSAEHAAQMKADGRLLYWNEASGEAVIAHRAFDYDWKRAQRQPEGDRPWIWCNITSLVPRKWHRAVGGFDEAMASWEDVDYWYRLARAGRPFQRIAEPLLVYRFYSGTRRDRGVGMNAELVAYLREKYKEIETVGCKGCGSRSSRRVAPAPTAARPVQAKPMLLRDEDFAWYIYMGPNRNIQPFTGAAEFDERINGLHMFKGRGGKWQIHYGMRKQGDEFLVHRRDAELYPHLLRPKEEKRPMEERPPTPPPVPIQAVEPEGEEVVIPVAEGGWKTGVEAVDAMMARDAPTLAEVATIRRSGNGPIDLQKLPGVSAPIAEQLQADGVTTLAAFLALGEEGLKKYSGVGPVKAKTIMRAVQNYGR